MTTVAEEVLRYPLGPEHRLDVDPAYRALQQRGAVRVRLPHGEPCWLATRYDDVRMVYGDRRFGRVEGLTHDPPGLFPGEHVKDPALLLNIDPPEHTRIRRLTSGAFSPARVAELQAWVQGIVDDLLDEMAAGGRSADFVDAFARRLPVEVLVGILGVAASDSSPFVAWVTDMSDHGLDVAARERARNDLHDYIRERIAERRAQPRDDLLSALVEARDEDDRLSEDELFGLCMALWGGGFKTTLMQLGTTVYTLMTHREHWQELLDDPALLPAALEELWRWIPSFRYGAPFVRWASEDLELSGGVLVRAGEPVLPEHAVANRDESVFPDGWELDFHRQDPRPHLSLAFGAHYCMGAHVALLQVRLAVQSLLQRFPTLELAVRESEVPFSTKSIMRSVDALPVRW